MGNKVLNRVRVCPVCGKEFFVQESGGYIYKKPFGIKNLDGKYKHTVVYWCSYGCMNKGLEKYRVNK